MHIFRSRDSLHMNRRGLASLGMPIRTPSCSHSSSEENIPYFRRSSWRPRSHWPASIKDEKLYARPDLLVATRLRASSLCDDVAECRRCALEQREKDIPRVITDHGNVKGHAYIFMRLRTPSLQMTCVSLSDASLAQLRVRRT